MIELASGVHAIGHGAGGHVRAFLVDDGGELTIVDTFCEGDARLVLEAIRALGRTPSQLKRIGITHAHRSHLGGLAQLKRASGATVYAHPWETDIVGGERRAQPVTLLPTQSLRPHDARVVGASATATPSPKTQRTRFTPSRRSPPRDG
jgi:glyoxylase-like metal-dependent hydrolase (beta-lactamase superfamily II)